MSIKERSCRVCGCTENKACRPNSCWWIEADLCSECGGKPELTPDQKALLVTTSKSPFAVCQPGKWEEAEEFVKLGYFKNIGDDPRWPGKDFYRITDAGKALAARLLERQ